MILIDTSVLIAFLRGLKTGKSEALQAILRDSVPFGITSAVFQEVLQGASSENEYRILRRYLETQRFYHPEDPVESYAEAARIFMLCRRQGITVRSTIDCLIAQIAIEHDLMLLHDDRDFDWIGTVVPLRIYS